MNNKKNSTSYSIIIIFIIIVFLVTPIEAIKVQTTTNNRDGIKVSNGDLLDSAWPMFHHDRNHSGRSPYAPLGNCPKEEWNFSMDGVVLSSPVLDQNGTIYIGADGEDCLFALNPDGTEKWRANIGNIVESPAIGADGTIYVGTVYGNLHAIYPNGTQRWQINLGTDSWTISSPVIDQNGTIYTASVQSSTVYAINPNGTIKWQFPTNDWIYSSPALADDGTIYIGSNDRHLYAINPDGTLKWKYPAQGCVQEAPAIDSQGNVYFGSWDSFLYSLSPNGTLRWKYNTLDAIDSSPAITMDEAIIIGNDAGDLYCINANGTLRWRLQSSFFEVSSSPAIDARGIIYFASDCLYALDSNGTILWRYAVGNRVIDSSPIIDEDGTIYLAGEYNEGSKFHAIGSMNDTKPATPSITGDENGHVRRKHDYTIVSSDPDNDNISYYIDWGDGKSTDWTTPTPSDQAIILSHTWQKKGTYTVKAKARDGHGMESNWGTLSITMPLTYEPPHFRFLNWLLERFPHAFPILRHIIKR
jgi:outer membrane protein assembly factor BamB